MENLTISNGVSASRIRNTQKIHSKNVSFNGNLLDDFKKSDYNVLNIWSDFMKFVVNNPYKLELTTEQLDDVVNNKVRTLDLNPVAQYDALKEGDKKALKHLVKAARILNDAFVEQELKDGLKIRESLETRAKMGDSNYQKALQIYNILNGVQDERKETLFLIKDVKLKPGRNVYPQDITAQEMIDYLKKNPDEIPQILSNNTVVKREKGKFVAVPYQVEYKKQFSEAAKELLAASETSTHPDFTEYLKLQAKALTSLDPEDGYKADVAWTKLSDTPLEFTIARESYSDEFTGEVLKDDALKQLIKDKKLEANPKDFFGIRVGIVDIPATRDLQDYKNHLKKMGEMMPFREKYKQSIDTTDPSQLVKQTLVDVNLVEVRGESCASRPSVTLAQNLPNGDKLSVQRGHGSRNVFHKDIRLSYDPEYREKYLSALLDDSQRDLYKNEADHLFTIGHELSHSLGPTTTLSGADKKSSLGIYGDAIEESKADLGAIVTSDYFVKVGKYTKKQQEELFLTWAMDSLQLEEPSMAQPHRVREVMQFNYFKEHGAIQFERGGKLKIVPEKFIPTANKMLEEVINIQLEGDVQKCGDFFKKWFVWSDALQYAADIKKGLNPKIYLQINKELANKLLT